MALISGLSAFGLALIGGALSSHSTTTQPAASGSAFLSSSVASVPPSRPAVAAPAITTSAAAPSPAAAMTLTCPSGNVASPVFGHTITATAPYTVTIDYGDGDSYSNTDQHLDAVFTHTYRSAGAFTVTASLTDATGQRTSSSCTYSRAATAPAPAPAAGGGASGGSGNTYTNSDGNRVPGPVSAPVAPVGATAQCNDGTWSFSQHHSGTCSSHGGVARWLG